MGGGWESGGGGAALCVELGGVCQAACFSFSWNLRENQGLGFRGEKRLLAVN